MIKIQRLTVIGMLLLLTSPLWTAKSDNSKNNDNPPKLLTEEEVTMITMEFYQSKGYFRQPQLRDSGIYLQAYRYLSNVYPDIKLGVDTFMWDFRWSKYLALTDSIVCQKIIERNHNVLLPLDQVPAPAFALMFKDVNETVPPPERVICFSDLFLNMLQCEIRPRETDKVGISGIPTIPYFIFYFNDAGILQSVTEKVKHYN